MKSLILIMLFISGSVFADPPPGPYNQIATFNQNMQYGSTNWYSSPLGQGAAMAGVAIVSGLVNAMSRPDPVIVVPSQQQQYTQPQTQYASQGNCRGQTLYDQSGNPRYVKVCD
jgi:hypothetical protein